eukprot:5653644-Heterocapsa_arctica.AAC.1
MTLHKPDSRAQTVFKEWLMSHWEAERKLLRNQITATEYAMTLYQGGGTNRKVFSDCISHLTVGGATTIDPRGRD